MTQIQPSITGQSSDNNQEGARQEIATQATEPRGAEGEGGRASAGPGDAEEQGRPADDGPAVEASGAEEAAAEDEDPDPAATEARLRERLAQAEAEIGPEAPGLFLPLVNLSTHLAKQGQAAEAGALARRILAITEQSEGPVSRRTAACRRYLSGILSAQGCHEEAEELLRQVIRHYQETTGKRCPDVARLLGELAEIQVRRERPRQARALCRRALRMMDRTADRLAPEAIQLLNTVAGVYHKIQDDERALRLYRRTLRRCERAGEAMAISRRIAELGIALALRILAEQRQEAGRIPDAIALATELIEHDPPAGYPLAAGIHEDAGDLVSAQRVLEAGVRALPENGQLWGQLGDLYGQQGLLGDAERAYERALSCPGVDQGRVRFQAGLNSRKRERTLEAIEHFSHVHRDNLSEDDESLHWEARSHRLLLLRTIGRDPEVRALAEEVLEEFGAAGPAPAQEDEPEETASLLCLGRALLYLRGDRAAARACALQAFRIDPDNLCLGLLRETACLLVDPARTRCLRISVTLPRTDPDSGERGTFVRTYLVVADSLAEGLSFIRALEERDDAGPVSLAEWTRLDTPPVGVRGVHGVSDYRAI